ncbi:IclR family transcriptional regulator [Methylobacterium currus]|uniref:IclR family transcriptional regulator n=1 Tax=Methylobacterium currus TaxID=2051553 RepID=A0A2R4WMD6_9HYPH|nr:IclR family transcriptional regulator [Methylobacterium currus]AWB22711.1 IclR family transcriptional regulator [Methylobacterium currus]UHC17691.1 IclR family transcriptional regulator [Methylobacterium currus]
MAVGNDDADERYKAPALDKGLDILELLSETEEGLSLAEIAKALDRSPNEIYRMLGRLVRRNYVVRTTADRYEISLKLFGLAHRHPPMRRLVGLALAPMRRFAREAEQSCHMVVYDRGSGVVLAQIDAPSYWGLSIRVGAHISLLNTGSGHVLLAFVSDAERAMMIEERVAVPNETWPERFEDLLAEVRERGYEIRPSQQTAGVTNIAVPVLDAGGRPLAALTCPQLDRLDGGPSPSREAILSLLLTAARDISAAAGVE